MPKVNVRQGCFLPILPEHKAQWVALLSPAMTNNSSKPNRNNPLRRRRRTGPHVGGLLPLMSRKEFSALRLMHQAEMKLNTQHSQIAGPKAALHANLKIPTATRALR